MDAWNPRRKKLRDFIENLIGNLAVMNMGVALILILFLGA